jgi:hypothetical protein
MTKRKHCPSDPVPAASVPSSSEQKFALQSSAWSAATPVQEARQSKSTVEMIVELITDPQNSVKVNDLSRISDTEVGDIHQEIATFVNTHRHTRWTKKNAWAFIRHIKETYNTAAELSKSIGNGDRDTSKLRNCILRVCPHYDTLEKVFRKQTLKPSAIPVNSSPASTQLCQIPNTQAHAKCSENNDNGGSSESSNDDTTSEDSNENGKPTLSLVEFLVEGISDMRLLRL